MGPDREAEEASAEPRRMMQSHDATMLLDPWPKGLLPTTLKRWLDGIRYGTMQGVPHSLAKLVYRSNFTMVFVGDISN